MKRKDYQNNIWYPITDDTYWVEEYKEEFPKCHTIIYHPKYCENLATQGTAYLGWGTMAKQGDWFFMIVETM